MYLYLYLYLYVCVCVDNIMSSSSIASFNTNSIDDDVKRLRRERFKDHIISSSFDSMDEDDDNSEGSPTNKKNSPGKDYYLGRYLRLQLILIKS